MAGHRNAAAYYGASSVHERMQDIAIPALILHGSNDPWVPAKTCLKLPVPEHPLTGISVVVTRGGGHVGFHDNRLNWHIRATLAWRDAVTAAGLGRDRGGPSDCQARVPARFFQPKARSDGPYARRCSSRAIASAKSGGAGGYPPHRQKGLVRRNKPFVAVVHKLPVHRVPREEFQCVRRFPDRQCIGRADRREFPWHAHRPPDRPGARQNRASGTQCRSPCPARP